MYLLFKHSHLTLVLISACFLVVRVIGASLQAQWLEQKWAKICPHIIDTLLLVSALALMFTLNQYPIVNAWLSAKIIALIAYIVLGAMALKGCKTPLTRFILLGLAITCIGYMASVALTKNPIPW